MPDMRHITYVSGAGPEGLSVISGPIPEPSKDEVLVKVEAAGVNRPDLIQRKGAYPPPLDASPVIGLEIAGTVVSCGSEVTRWSVGDKVCALANGGGYAEYCVAPETQCLRWPEGYDAVRAAAIPETYFTVWANLFAMGDLKAGESVLVHGGTSGIGTTAVQLAHAFGATVYATAGTDEKTAKCAELGAKAGINYKTQIFEDEIATLTDGRGVDVVLDIVGAPYLDRNLNCLAKDGRLLLIAAMFGSKTTGFDLRQIMSRRVWITGSALRPRTRGEKGAIASALEAKVWPLLDAKKVSPIIHAVVPFDTPSEAHRILEEGQHVGKIVLKIV